MSHSPRLKKSVSYFIDLLHRGNKIAPPFFPKSFLFLCLTSKAKREHSKTNRDFLPFNAAGNRFFARFFQTRRIYRLQLTISCTTLLLSKTNTNNNKFYPSLKVELKLLYSTALYFLLTLHRLNIYNNCGTRRFWNGGKNGSEMESRACGLYSNPDHTDEETLLLISNS